MASVAVALARALLRGAVRGRGGGLRRPLAEPSALWLRGLAGPGPGRGDDGEEEAAAKGRRVRQLLYRSKQRGFLELDILVGEWAQANLAGMTMAELDEISGFLDQENPDMFQWITGQKEPPQEVAAMKTFQSLDAFVRAKLKAANEEAKDKEGKEWVRGWNDSGSLSKRVDPKE